MFRNEAETSLATLILLVALLSGSTGFLIASQVSSNTYNNSSAIAQQLTEQE
jgi:hypothetical protein